MARIEISALRPGMTLQRDVTDPSGRVLLRSLTEVNDNHIRIMRAWGVYHVEVVSDEQAPCTSVATPSEATLQDAKVATDAQFRSANTEHPAMQMIYELALDRNARRIEGILT